MEVPAERPSKFIVIDKTGSGLSEHIRSTTVAIQSYDVTKAKASKLNDEVIKQMLNITELDSVSRVELNTDYPFPDTSNKGYRYQAVFDLIHY